MKGTCPYCRKLVTYGKRTDVLTEIGTTPSQCWYCKRWFRITAFGTPYLALLKVWDDDQPPDIARAYLDHYEAQQSLEALERKRADEAG